jgi:dihydrofolate synthase/folylpolyglutamate synthase
MIRNFDEARKALRYFYGATGLTGPYTLDRMQALMQHLDNPQDTMRILHVAGTSGKTSTAYYGTTLLEADGTDVGLTVSPHVDEVNERIQINHVPLPEAVFCEELDTFLGIVKAGGLRPSYFEFMIAFAFWEFAKRKVAYAVVEVGLGGLLDATNVITRADKVCIITDIGLDHTNVLGNTLGEISTQKAGIIQSLNHVFMYTQSEEVMAPVRARCESCDATLHLVAPYSIQASKELPLFQQRNLYLAEQAVNYMLTRDSGKTLTPTQIQRAEAVVVPARMEILKVAGKTVIVDGSHNGQKIGALAESIRAKFPGQSIAALVGFIQDVDERWQRGVSALSELTDHLIVTAFTVEQDVPKNSMDPERIVQYCQSIGYQAVEIETDPKAALTKLLACPEPIVLVTGSFYLLNHIRPLLK